METLAESNWRLLPRALNVLAWGTTLGLFAALAVRFLFFDATYFFIWLNAFTVYTYLPAYACLAWGLATRRWRLAICNALIIACHLMWVVPAYATPARHGVTSEAALNSTDALRIFFANIRAGNAEFDSMFREIDEANPDLVVLVEFSPSWHRAAQRSPVLNKFPHRLDIPYSSPAVYSKFPISGKKVDWPAGDLVVSFDVETADQTVRVVSIHGPRPIMMPDQDYFAFWRRVPSILVDQPVPTIVVGDFNATQFSKVQRGLMADGWNSAHQWVGRGYATTWPNGRNWAPPIRIDHVLFRGPVKCLAIAEGIGRGSDHRPLVADFLLLSPNAARLE